MLLWPARQAIFFSLYMLFEWPIPKAVLSRNSNILILQLAYMIDTLHLSAHC